MTYKFYDVEFPCYMEVSFNSEKVFLESNDPDGSVAIRLCKDDLYDLIGTLIRIQNKLNKDERLD